MSLADLQRRFYRLVTGAERVELELPAAAAGDPGIAPLHAWIRADDEAAAIERLDVYANMYFFRLLECIEGDYPKLAHVLGHERFHNLVTGYLQAHPSTYASIRWVGCHLDTYIAARQPALLPDVPAAAALARLEWLRGEAFDAANAPALSADELAQVTPDRWPLLRLRMQPGLRLVELDHDVLPLWLAIERGAEEVPPAPPADPPAAAVIWRRGHRVWHRPTAPAELEALRAAVDGASFAELCQQLYRHAGDTTAEVVVGYLRDWVTTGMVAGYDLPPALVSPLG